MSNPWSIGKCETCNQLYCWECSEAEEYDKYCSPSCEREAGEEEAKE